MKKPTNLVLVFAIVISLIGLFAVQYLSRQNQDNRSQASNENRSEVADEKLAQLNKQLLNKANPGLGQIISQDNRSIDEIALERKNLLIEKIRMDPKNAKEYIFDEKNRNALSSKISEDLLEAPIKIKGPSTQYLSEDFENQIYFYQYVMYSETDGQTYDVYSVNDDTIISDEPITVQGVNFDNIILAEEIDSSTSAPMPNGLSNNLKIAVIKYDYLDKSFPYQENLQDLFFNDQDSVNNFFKTDSNNSISIEQASFREFGVVTLPINESTFDYRCQYHIATKMAEGFALEAGYSPSDFDIVVRMGPALSGCFSGSNAQISRLNDTDPLEITLFTSNKKTITHEIGHTLSLQHASAIHCLESEEIMRFDSLGDFDSTNCIHDEYGDSSSIMGSNYATNNFIHKYHLNLIDPTKIIYPDTSGIISIGKLSGSHNLPVAAVIPIPNGTLSYLLTYKAGGNFFDDTHQRSESKAGAQMHFWESNSYINNYYHPQSFTVDLTPPENNFMDIDFFGGDSLEDNQEYIDNFTGISIKQVSHDQESVRLDVQFLDTNTCKKYKPSVETSTLKQEIFLQQTATFFLTVKNNNTSNCSPETFILSNNRTNGFEKTLSTSSLTLDSGAEEVIELQISPSAFDFLSVNREYEHSFTIESSVQEYSYTLITKLQSETVEQIKQIPSVLVTEISQPISFNLPIISRTGEDISSQANYTFSHNSSFAITRDPVDPSRIILQPINLTQTTSNYLLGRIKIGQENFQIRIPVYFYKDERLPEIARIELSPGEDIQMDLADRYTLSALAYDAQNNPLHEGVSYSWGASSIQSFFQLSNSNTNVVEIIPYDIGHGNLWVTATNESSQLKKSISVTVGNPSDQELSEVRIHPAEEINLKVGEKVDLSSLGYDALGEPIWNSLVYIWGISSNGSIGNITSYNKNTNTFIAMNPGEGDLWVTASDNFGNSVTKSLRVTVTESIESEISRADINQNGKVDIFDLLILSIDYNQANPANPRSDINRDGDIGIKDLLLLSKHYFAIVE